MTQETERLPFTSSAVSESFSPLEMMQRDGGGGSGGEELITAQDDSIEYNENDQDAIVVPVVDPRVIAILRSIPDRTIRPGRLAAEFGMNMDDANAELCKLLAAVGGGEDGASFRFEPTVLANKHENETSTASSTTMVFTFPPDFERRAMRRRRKQEFWQILQHFFWILVKGIKIVTAFGIILSLLILSVAAAAGIIAAIIVMTRADSGGGGHRHHRTQLIHRARAMFYTIRQFLWCYALFGPTPDDPETNTPDPFFREVAYDLWLLCSVCCGNPGSIFFWMRANQLQHRRLRTFRRWGVGPGTRNDTSSTLESDIPGVTLLRRRDNVDSNAFSINSQQQQQQEKHRGLLSVVVEFLFGPTPFTPGPTQSQKWMLRARMLLETSAQNAGIGVSLEEMAPYTDDPPHSTNDTARIIEQGLMIVSHFNGKPLIQKHGSSTEKQSHDNAKARFIFPELVAEGTSNVNYSSFDEMDGYDDGTWEALLFAKQEAATTRTPETNNSLPTFLKEERYKFTKLTLQQLMYCILIGTLNLIGVIGFQQSLLPGGILEVPSDSLGAILLLRGLLPVLKFYAMLFFVLPGTRLCLILVLNYFRKQRNQRRNLFASRNLVPADVL
jgi:hypothetical protein